MFSNKYIFIYASIMVIAVAAILSAAAMFLQPFQERNVNVEKIQNILTSAGIVSTKENAEKLFNNHIVAQVLIDRNGKIVNDNRKAFEMDLKSELQKLEELESGKSQVEPAFPLFVCKNGADTTYIIPVLGKGLWGPLWGYIALKSDCNTIVGVVFDHKGETPGLGAEIATPAFQEQFVGKKIFDDKEQFVSVAVVKGGVANSSISEEYGVDAISGGTITSNGLADMLKVCLENYLAYFKGKRDEILVEQVNPETDTIVVEPVVEMEVAIPKPAPRPRPVETPESEPEWVAPVEEPAVSTEEPRTDTTEIQSL